MKRIARWLRHRARVLCVCLAMSPAYASDKEGERQHFKDQRAAIEAEFKRGEKECAQRFEVTRCVDALEQQRRAALGDLRQQEIAIDDARRRAEAQANEQRLKDKQAKAAGRAASTAAAPAASSAASDAGPASPKRSAQKDAKATDPAEAAEARQARAAAAAQAASAAAKKSAERAQQRAIAAQEAIDEASAAAKRAAAREQRLAEAAERRERVEQRNARRAESGKAAAALPDPAASAPPR